MGVVRKFNLLIRLNSLGIFYSNLIYFILLFIFTNLNRNIVDKISTHLINNTILSSITSILITLCLIIGKELHYEHNINKIFNIEKILLYILFPIIVTIYIAIYA